MGGHSSRHVDESSPFPFVRGSKEAIDINRKIDKQLRKDYSEEAQTVKLLLLGAGQSGKSTVVKQMKLIHPLMDRSEVGFTENERNDAQIAIYINMVESINALLDAVASLNIEGIAKLMKTSEDEERIQKLGNIINDYGDQILSLNSINRHKPQISDLQSVIPTEEVKLAFKELWESQTIQQAYARKNEFQLIDSTEYFMSSMDRIFSEDYEPNDQDILRTRVKTTGVVRIEFDFHATKFEMLDVGGQRSERKKWIHCFDNVTCVLFIVSIAEYDQVLEEDRTTNRMYESMELFDEIANNQYFKNTPFIIFFNKHDLFLEKISKKGIKEIFPEYQGADNSPNDSLDFLIEKYLNLSKTSRKKRHLYPHTTTATDTQLINKVFGDVAEIILNDVLNRIGFA